MHTVSTGAKVNKLACFLPIMLVLNFKWRQNYLIVLRSCYVLDGSQNFIFKLIGNILVSQRDQKIEQQLIEYVVPIPFQLICYIMDLTLQEV